MADEEDAEALLHVLAFLDALEGNGLQTLGDSDVLPLECSKRAQRLASKTRYRRRVKDEHSRLRSDVRLLEATLAQLQQSPHRDPHAWSRPRSSATWTQLASVHTLEEAAAARESKRRKHSEAVNRELKALLSKTRKTSAATAVSWESLLTEKNLTLLQVPHTARGSDPHCQLSDHYYAGMSLSERIERLALDTDRHFDRAGLTGSDSFSFRTQRAVDSRWGPAYEISMSSSVASSKELAASSILRSFVCDDACISRQQIQDNDSKFIRKTRKSVRLGLQQFTMEGACTTREIKEPDRIRFIWSTLSYLPDAAVSFREDCIIALETPAESPATCQLQIWYRVFAEPLTSNVQTEPESTLLMESVLRSHCRTTGEFFQSVENMLANEAYHPCA